VQAEICVSYSRSPIHSELISFSYQHIAFSAKRHRNSNLFMTTLRFRYLNLKFSHINQSKYKSKYKSAWFGSVRFQWLMLVCRCLGWASREQCHRQRRNVSEARPTWYAGRWLLVCSCSRNLYVARLVLNSPFHRQQIFHAFLSGWVEFEAWSMYRRSVKPC